MSKRNSPGIGYPFSLSCNSGNRFPEFPRSVAKNIIHGKKIAIHIIYLAAF